MNRSIVAQLTLAAAFWLTPPALAADAPPAAMPPGHPDISSIAPASRPSTAAMPAGHPNISGMPPTSRPTGPGLISVLVHQGTKDGPPVTEMPVVVDLYHHGQVMDEIEATTDVRGATIVKDLPVQLPVTPEISVTYKGVKYSTTGKEMDATNRAQHIDLTVYETTEQAPAWTVSLRHVGIRKSEAAVSLTDVFQLHNPSDRTWAGLTLTVPLSEGIENADYGGLPDGASVKWEGNSAVVSMPLVPGDSGFYLVYTTKQKDGGRLAFKAPWTVGEMKVMVPHDFDAEVHGLKRTQSVQSPMGGQDMDVYAAQDLRPGAETVVTISLAKPAGGGFASTPRIIAIVGGALILIVGAGILLAKGKKPAPEDAHRARG
jgi:hypothetical protein